MKFFLKYKKVLKIVFLFIVVAFITFSYSCLCTWLIGDEVWNYGFSYNLSEGLIIYRDFNCMQTPLFFFLGSIFIKIFGNYLYSLYLLIAFLNAFIMVCFYRVMKGKAFIILPFLLIVHIPSYNFLCLLFLCFMLYLVHFQKDNDAIMGFIIGLLFLSKQSLGIMLIAFLFFAKNKFKGLVSFLIPIILCLIYLIYHDALFEFINYCFLGLFDFGEKNGVLSIFTFLECLVLIYLVVQIVKTKFKDKELFYILMFQIMAYPIFEIYHFLIAFIPVMYYFIKKQQSKSIIMFIALGVYSLFFSLNSSFSFTINEKDNLFYLLRVHHLNDVLEKESEIILRYTENYDYSFYIMVNAYLRKLYMEMPISQYDFMLNGNMGYRGEEKYIQEIDSICQSKSCVFFVDEDMFKGKYTQFSREIYNYVIQSYSKVEESDYFNVYTN